MPTPMPGFVGDAVAIAARIGHHEAEAERVAAQPLERGRLRELFFECCVAWRGEIERATTVVFAVAGCRAHTQDLFDGLAAREFALDDAELVVRRAERRDYLKLNRLRVGRGAHACKGQRGARCEPLLAAMDIGADRSELSGFTHEAQLISARMVGRNAEFAGARDDFGTLVAVATCGQRAVDHCAGVSSGLT